MIQVMQIKYLRIYLQNIKMNKKSLYSLQVKAKKLKKDNTYIYSLIEGSKAVLVFKRNNTIHILSEETSAAVL